MDSINTIYEDTIGSAEEEKEDDVDDDYEGYFLKPANEYNIHEKIKEANQELFTIIQIQQTSEGESGKGMVSRKVTFRSNLEDFEPDEEVSLDLHSSAESIEESCVVEEHIVEIVTDGVVEEEVAKSPQQQDDEWKQEEIALEEDATAIITETLQQLVISVVENETEQEKPLEKCAPNQLNIKKSTVRKKKPNSAVAATDSNPALCEVDLPKCKACYERKRRQLLPNYIGDLQCEYGLSRQQLVMKNLRQENKRRQREELAFQKYEKELERSRANEEAFARWLRNKVPKNKYVNRYDEISTTAAAATKRKKIRTDRV